MTGKIDGDRLWRRVMELAELTERERPYTRRSFTDLFLEGRVWLGEQFAGAGLELSIDSGGNLVGRRAGSRDELPPLVIGSHSDTVPGGGRFDGIAGVLAGLEVAQTLGDYGVTLRHPLEVVDFLAEEPSEYGLSCVGSRTWSGHISTEDLKRVGPDGETLGEAIQRVGGVPSLLGPEPLRKPGSLACYLELHIEQARVLESKGLSVGIVTEIVGITRHRVTFVGRIDHAGSTPMGLRHDALVGAARFIDGVSGKATAFADGEDYFVATVGQIAVAPNAFNVVPGEVSLVVEHRSNAKELSKRFSGELERLTNEIATALELTCAFETVSTANPAICDAFVRDTIRNASEDSGNGYLIMACGAGHDAMHMADIAPMGMILVPSRDGRSHCPEEWTGPDDLAAGVDVLYETVLSLDATLD